MTVSSDLILRDILNITDLRSDKRIDFVGGIRGLEELQRRGQRRDGNGARSLPRHHGTTHHYCRYRQHHASQDNMVRAETPFRSHHPQARLINQHDKPLHTCTRGLMPWVQALYPAELPEQTNTLLTKFKFNNLVLTGVIIKDSFSFL